MFVAMCKYLASSTEGQMTVHFPATLIFQYNPKIDC